MRSMNRPSDPPLKIILVIDTLDLPGLLPSDERLAVEAFLQKNGGQLTQPVSTVRTFCKRLLGRGLHVNRWQCAGL